MCIRDSKYIYDSNLNPKKAVELLKKALKNKETDFTYLDWSFKCNSCYFRPYSNPSWKRKYAKPPIYIQVFTIVGV